MEKKYLSKGWKFPICVDSSTGRIQTVSGEEDIKEAIKIILLTTYKERVMKSEFGSNMKDFIFSNSTQSTYSSMEIEAKNSIEIWESRVKNVIVKVYPDKINSNILYIDVECTIKSTENILTQVVTFSVL